MLANVADGEPTLKQIVSMCRIFCSFVRYSQIHIKGTGPWDETFSILSILKI